MIFSWTPKAGYPGAGAVTFPPQQKRTDNMQVPEYVYGAIAPVFTAFNQDGTLDDAGQRNLMDYMVQAGGVNAYFIRCGMGQMFSFGMDDSKQLIKNVCSHFDGKVPVLAGCSGIWDRNYDARPAPGVFLQQAIELSKFAEDAGAAGVVHTIPEAVVPAEGMSMDDFLVDYYSQICAAVKLPVFIYQSPGTLPNYCVTRNSLSRLADIDNMIGIKVSSADGTLIFDLCYSVREKQDRFAYIVGAEMGFFFGLSVGARACIGQGTTLNPKVIRAVADRYHAGDMEGAIEAQNDVNLLVYECSSPIEFFKAYVTEKGFPVQLYSRGSSGNPYQTQSKVLSPEQYAAFKKYFEATLEKYQ